MSDLLARLIAAGTPADLVAEVAKELARAEVAQEAIQQRRAKDNARQARRRGKYAEDTNDHVMSRDNTDVTQPSSLPLPPNEKNSIRPTPTHPERYTPHAREAGSTADDCATVVAEWNATAKPLGLPACQKLSPARRKACQARLRDDGLAAIQQAIQRVPGSAFLRGETGDWSGANIDFLLRPDTVTKILEGKYDDRNRNSAQPGNVRSFGKPKDGAIAALDRRLGLDGGPGAYSADDPDGSQANCGRALAHPRRLFG